MCLLEVEPDSHPAIWIDRQLAIVVDVAELLGRGIVKNEDDRRQPARKIQLFVEHIRHVHRTVAAVVEQLQILAELAALTRVIAVVVRDQVIFQHHYSSHLVGDAIGLSRALCRNGRWRVCGLRARELRSRRARAASMAARARARSRIFSPTRAGGFSIATIAPWDGWSSSGASMFL